MESKTFGPLVLELTEADEFTDHARVSITLTTQPTNPEQALLIEYKVAMADGSPDRQQQQTLRRDQVYNLPHWVRQQMKEMNLFTNGAHNPDNHGAYIENMLGIDKLIDKINDALGIKGDEVIDLDRLLREERD